MTHNLRFYINADSDPVNKWLKRWTVKKFKHKRWYHCVREITGQSKCVCISSQYTLLLQTKLQFAITKRIR